MKYKQGKFLPKNPEKYLGNSLNIVYRSSWEHRFMLYLDYNISVKKWASEEIVIPYFWEGDNKMHRYYPDFYMEVEDKNLKYIKYVIEIKPIKDTVIKQPKIMNEKTQRQFADNIMTVSKNKAKWEAAEIWCKERNILFKVITEKELF